MATRHMCRLIAVQALYEWDFSNHIRSVEDIVKENMKEWGGDIDEPDFSVRLAKGVTEHAEFLDEKIKKYASGWSFDELPITERNVLRLAIFELFFQNKDEVPAKVAINEAVDLGKSLCGENSAKFINGVLASVYEEIQAAEKTATA